MDDSALLLRWLVVFGLIGLNAFFAAVEYAVVSARRSRIAVLAESGSPAARMALRWLEDARHRDEILATVQVGITMVGLALGWFGERTLSATLNRLLALPSPAPLVRTLLQILPLTLNLTFILGLQIVLGEQVPKIATLRASERVLLSTLGPMRVIYWLLRPLVWALHRVTDLVLRALRISADGYGMMYTIEELKRIVDETGEAGVLEPEAREILEAVFDLGQIPARQIMVPRTEIVAVEADAPMEQIVDAAIRTGYDKFPVYEGDLDHIIGVVHLREALKAWREGRPARARDLCREVMVVPDSIRVDDLLRQFQEREEHLAILVDEFGGTLGLVTLRDVLEQLVGELHERMEPTEPDVVAMPDGSYLISGLLPIQEVNERFQLDLQDPYYETIAGFVLGRLGRIARVGDEVDAGVVRLRVEAMDGLRIARLRLIPQTGR
ncbi:hemolysin family protein [Thermoflexus sp.]|uniref:hemolysin family protein n=1 Tax=Thermoflexus sp. TaxID=1969742 RepID=UPI002ADDC8E3|nr:hemolysin family protein [Thermoflexus sp.]